jgi:glutathione S-transferase
VRRLVYAELLPRFPELAKPSLFGKASGPHRLAANAMWPLSRRIMMRMHDITPDAAAESRSILESELDWLDSTLADNRRYLSGDRFSRADITVASLSWPFLPDPTRCRHIARCPSLRLSLPTANAGAIGR